MNNQINRISVSQLNNISKNKEICCLGCGKRFYEMLKNYSEEPFINSIVRIFDNNQQIQGMEVNVGKNILKILPFEELCSIEGNNVICLITSDSAESIFLNFKRLYSGEISLYLYPRYYRKSTEFWLKFFSGKVCKNRLLFYAGKEPHENADAILFYIKNNNKKLKVVYYGHSDNDVITILNDDVSQKHSYIKMLRYCYYYGSSKYLFYENEALEKINPKQKLIFLNHGTIPLKRVNDVLKQNDNIDYALCPAEGCAEFYENQYGIKNEKLIYIMPARTYSMLTFKGNNPWKKSDEKVTLWLPTFRQLVGTLRKDSEQDSAFNIIESESEWKELNELLKKTNQRLLIKKHPRDGSCININTEFSNIQFISDMDLQEQKIGLNQLLATTDVLLTDYSGIAFEYMLLNRPIGYVIHDIDKYTRGFSVENPDKYMPGVKIRNYNELIEFFKTVYLSDDYELSRKSLINELFSSNGMTDGAANLINLIIEGRL